MSVHIKGWVWWNTPVIQLQDDLEQDLWGSLAIEHSLQGESQPIRDLVSRQNKTRWMPPDNT